MLDNVDILLLVSRLEIETKNQIGYVTNDVEVVAVGSIDNENWTAVANMDGVPLGKHHGHPLDSVEDILQNADGQNILDIWEVETAETREHSKVAGHRELAVGSSSKWVADVESDAMLVLSSSTLPRKIHHKAGVVGNVVHAMVVVPSIRLWLGKNSTLELREH